MSDGSVRLVEDRVQALIFLWEHHRKLSMEYKRVGEEEAARMEAEKVYRAFAALEEIAYTKCSRVDSRGFYVDETGQRLPDINEEDDENDD